VQAYNVTKHACVNTVSVYRALTPVHTIRVHGPWTRPVNTGVILDTREHGRVNGPCW